MDAGEAASLLEPRHGVVLEAVEETIEARRSPGAEPARTEPAGTGLASIPAWAFRSFRQQDGPLASYRRTVELETLG